MLQVSVRSVAAAPHGRQGTHRKTRCTIARKSDDDYCTMSPCIYILMVSQIALRPVLIEGVVIFDDVTSPHKVSSGSVL